MKLFRLLVFVCGLLSLNVSAAVTNTITFNLRDFLDAGYSNRSITISPLSTPRTNPPYLVVSAPITRTTDASGNLILTNVYDGTYNVSIAGSPVVTAFKIYVGTNQGAAWSASGILTTNVDPNSTSTYTRSQIDGRFVSRAGTNVTFRTNGGLVYIDAAGGTNSSGTNSGNYVLQTNGFATNLTVNGLLAIGGISISNAIISGEGATGSASAEGNGGGTLLLMSGNGGAGGAADGGSNGDGGPGGTGGLLWIKGGNAGNGGAGDGSGSDGGNGNGGDVRIFGGSGDTWGTLYLQTSNGSVVIGNTNPNSSTTITGTFRVSRTTTNGHVATVDGSGGITFQPPSGGGTNRYTFVVATNYVDLQTAPSSNSHAFRLGEANQYSNALTPLNIPRGEWTLFATFDGSNGVGSNLVQQPLVGTFAGLFGEGGAIGGSANFLLRTNGHLSLAKGSNTPQTFYYFMQSASTNPIRRVVANFDVEREQGTNYSPHLGLIISANGSNYNSTGFGNVAHILWYPHYNDLNISFWSNGYGATLIGSSTLSWTAVAGGTNLTVEYSIEGDDVWASYQGVWKKATIPGLTNFNLGNYLCVEYYDIELNWSSNNAPGRWFLDSVAASPNPVIPANAGNFLIRTNGTGINAAFNGSFAVNTNALTVNQHKYVGIGYQQSTVALDVRTRSLNNTNQLHALFYADTNRYITLMTGISGNAIVFPTNQNLGFYTESYPLSENYTAPLALNSTGQVTAAGLKLTSLANAPLGVDASGQVYPITVFTNWQSVGLATNRGGLRVTNGTIRLYDGALILGDAPGLTFAGGNANVNQVGLYFDGTGSVFAPYANTLFLRDNNAAFGWGIGTNGGWLPAATNQAIGSVDRPVGNIYSSGTNTVAEVQWIGNGWYSFMLNAGLSAFSTNGGTTTNYGTVTGGRIVSSVVNVTGTNIDWSLGNRFIITNSSTRLLSHSNAANGQEITVAILNNSTNTVTWTNLAGGAILWQATNAPTISTNTTVFWFSVFGTNLYGAAGTNFASRSF